MSHRHNPNTTVDADGILLYCEPNKYPRHSITVVPDQYAVLYCLQGDERAQCVRRDSNNNVQYDTHGHLHVKLCNDCFTSIQHQHIPKHSLVCVDTGVITDPDMEELTFLESLLLCPYRVMRALIALRAVGDDIEVVKALRGHCIAFRNVTPQDICRAIPCNLEDIPQFMTVMLTVAANSHEHAQQQAARCTALHVRGSVVWKHAHRMQRIYRARGLDVNLNVQAQHQYESLNGVPQPLLNGVLWATTQDQAKALHTALVDQRVGYAPVRLTTDIGNQLANEVDAGVLQRPHFMSGLDSVELEFDASPKTNMQDIITERLQRGDTLGTGTGITFSMATADPPMESGGAYVAPYTAERVQAGDALVVGAPMHSRPVDDYKRDWFIFAHPKAFPNGTGGRPEGMSEDAWVNLLLNRFPRSQFSANALFILDAMDIITRHRVNLHSSLQMSMSMHTVASIGTLSVAHVEAALKILTGKLRGNTLAQALATQPPAVRDLLRAYHVTSGRVPGTSGELMQLRSKFNAYQVVFGSFSAMVNLNPSELHAHLFYELTGKQYSDDMLMHDKWATVTTHPGESAHFFELFMRAAVTVLFGWDLQLHKQVNRNCLFGVIDAWAIRFETNSRGVLHLHGGVIMPVLQARRLQHMLQSDTSTQKALFDFTESIMCQYLPHPYYYKPDAHDDRTAIKVGK